MPVGVELSLVQVGGVHGDVHHLLLRLALGHVVDPRHWERPLLPDAQTYLWDEKSIRNRLFLDALASLRPILFSESVSESVSDNFFGLQIALESISENVIGLCQYQKHQC